MKLRFKLKGVNQTMKKAILVSLSLVSILTACSAHPTAEPIPNSSTPTQTLKVEQNTISPSATQTMESVSMVPSTPSPTSSANPSPSTETKPTIKPNTTPTSNKSGSIKHVAVNESIMSTGERKKLDSNQREWIALLDDYQYYFNLQTNKDGIYNDVNYGTIETSIPFGVGILSIVVTDVPPYIDTKRDYSFDLKAHVELNHSQKDKTPYYSEDSYFRFIYRNDRWYINLWGI